MNERYVRRLATLCTTVVLIGLLLPTFFGTARKNDGTGGDAWRNVIQDFQTLFAGILAVGAAYATIRQMQKSDARSDQRHEQLIKLSLRTDALEIERALYPALQRLYAHYAVIRNYGRLSELAPLANDTVPSDELIKALTEIAPTAESIILDLKIFALPSTAKLIGGHLTRQIELLKSAAARLQSKSLEAYKAINSELAFTLQYVETPSAVSKDLLDKRIAVRIEAAELVISLMEQVEVASEHVFQGLLALAQLYELEIPTSPNRERSIEV